MNIQRDINNSVGRPTGLLIFILFLIFMQLVCFNQENMPVGAKSAEDVESVNAGNFSNISSEKETDAETDSFAGDNNYRPYSEITDFWAGLYDDSSHFAKINAKNTRKAKWNAQLSESISICNNNGIIIPVSRVHVLWEHRQAPS